MECPDCGEDGYKRLSQHLALTDCSYPEFTNKQIEVIIGTLMGDATLSLHTQNAKNAQYIIKVIKKDYLRWLTDFFPEWFLETDSVFLAQTGEESYEDNGLENPGNKENYSDIYGIASKRHPKLTKLKENWYRGSDKVFPDGIELTPTILKHWFVTDGNLRHRSENCYRAVFNSVNESYRPKFVESMFKNVGLDAKYDGYHKFRLTADSTREMFCRIGEPLPGFDYKWPDQKP